MKEWKHGQVDVKRQIQITCTVNNTYNLLIRDAHQEHTCISQKYLDCTFIFQI